MDITNLHERIKEFRTQKGISQTKLAKSIGYNDRSSISRLESGELDLPLSKLEDLSKALEVSISTLLSLPSDDKITIEVPFFKTRSFKRKFESINIDRKFANYNHLIALYVDDLANDTLEYMEDDILIFEKRQNYRRGDLVFVSDKNRLFLRLARYTGYNEAKNEYEFISLQHDGKPFDIADTGCEIHGVAIQLIRNYLYYENVFILKGE